MLQAVRLLTELARPAENNHHHHHHHPNNSEQQQNRQRGREMEGTAETTARAAVSLTSSSSSSASSSATTGSILPDASIQFREIYKNGWLRRTDKSDKETNRFWVVFCVHDDTEPRLEGYADQKQANAHSPTWAQSLREIQHLSPTLCATQRHDYEFCVNISDHRVLRLASPTYQGMLDWVQLVTRKLTDMKILRPKENLYSKGPDRIATRDPTSPLPPPPLSTGSSMVQGSATSSTGASNSPPASNSSAGSTAAPSTPSATPGTCSSGGRESSGRGASDAQSMIFTFDDISLDEGRRSPRPSSGSQRSSPPIASNAPDALPTIDELGNPGDSGYESIFMASSYSPTGGDSSRPNRENSQSEPSNELYAALMEYRSSQVPRPPALRPAQLVNPSTRNTLRPLTLRERQVSQLQREMDHPGGVRLLLGRRHCKDSIAFVDTYGAVWVAGWKHRDHPMLYNVLHVGDLVLSVAGVAPAGASAVRNILKGCTTPRVEVIVRRLPYARAVTLKKRNNHEDFGLEVNANEVSRVYGWAVYSMPPLATATDPTVPTGSNTTWTLTEINGRPLNIFDGGVDERFRAVGLDISIVIQPTDLISSLRKNLHSLRSFKNFVMQ